MEGLEISMTSKILAGTLLSFLCISGSAFALPGVVTVDGAISGTYQTSSGNPIDDYEATLEATFVQYNGSPAYGYATGYPRQKHKYYDAGGYPLNGDPTPGILVPSPDTFGGGGYGGATPSGEGTLDSLGPLYLDGTPQGSHALIRHWKLEGYAGSQQAQAQGSCNVLAPVSNEITF